MRTKTYCNYTTNVVYQQNCEPTNDYWKAKWKKVDDASILKLWQKENGRNQTCRITKKYLGLRSLILEAGCGIGQEAVNLTKAGFVVTGIDSDADIINRLREIGRDKQERFEVADARSLVYEDQSFDGYWSLGVIEHFVDGYESILKEAYRVLRPGGFAFILFPSENLLTRVKRYLRLYQHKALFNKRKFHQFLLNTDLVLSDAKEMGFSHCETKHWGGAKGCCREIGLPKIMSNRSKVKAIRMIWYLLNKPLSLFAWHTSIVVLKKEPMS